MTPQFRCCLVLLVIAITILSTPSLDRSAIEAQAPRTAASKNGARAELDQGRALLRRSQADQALGHLDSALQLYQQAGNPEGKAAANDASGTCMPRRASTRRHSATTRKPRSPFAMVTSLQMQHRDRQDRRCSICEWATRRARQPSPRLTPTTEFKRCGGGAAASGAASGGTWRHRSLQEPMAHRSLGGGGGGALVNAAGIAGGALACAALTPPPPAFQGAAQRRRTVCRMDLESQIRTETLSPEQRWSSNRVDPVVCNAIPGNDGRSGSRPLAIHMRS
jgi:hypothetical protein